MDHCSLPKCAVERQVTTVIIINKMKIIKRLCPSQERPGYPDVLRPSDCENCNRTRIILNKFSDCDSGLVSNTRIYKSRAARSRYVNVCAVVCLLLLFGGLSPRSSAAPYRSRAMDRQKRSPDEENSLWGNPCNYNQTNSNAEYTPKNAQYVLRQAKFTYTEALKYKDEFTNKLFTVSSFDELSSTFSEIHWLRNEKWFREEVLPKEKVLYQAMSEDAMSQLMEKIDEVLPSMYKGLKLVLAGLHVFTGSLRNTNISTDANLTEKLDKTMVDVRSVLCYFYDLMVSRNLQIEPLRDSEIPEMTKGNQLSMGFLIYRDTLNYLEYISQVFQTMAETELTKAV